MAITAVADDPLEDRGPSIGDLPPAQRSMDDVLAGVIRFSLGGRPFAMAALPMAAHDRWQEAMDSANQAAFDSVPERGGMRLIQGLNKAFGSIRDQLLDALIAYDRDGVLPSRDEIRELATQQDIIIAVREVRAVGGDPLAVSALSAFAGVGARARPASSTLPSAPMNGSRKNTGGRRRRSGKN